MTKRQNYEIISHNTTKVNIFTSQNHYDSWNNDQLNLTKKSEKNLKKKMKLTKCHNEKFEILLSKLCHNEIELKLTKSKNWDTKLLWQVMTNCQYNKDYNKSKF